MHQLLLTGCYKYFLHVHWSAVQKPPMSLGVLKVSGCQCSILGLAKERDKLLKERGVWHNGIAPRPTKLIFATVKVTQQSHDIVCIVRKCYTIQ